MNAIKTLDDIKDLSIIIVDKMVENGIIKDCTDTDDQTECDAQDVIREILYREWTCKSCGVVHDRDVNASRNILKEGLKIYRQGLSITKVEDKSDYLGSTSVETRSPSHRFSVGG